jgi:hypothetical protein
VQTALDVDGAYGTNPDSGEAQQANPTLTSNNCGASALYCICKLAKRPHTLESLKELTSSSSSGTTMLNLRRAALKIGFEVDGRHGSFDALQRHVRGRNAYAIVHTWTRVPGISFALWTRRIPGSFESSISSGGFKTLTRRGFSKSMAGTGTPCSYGRARGAGVNRDEPALCGPVDVCRYFANDGRLRPVFRGLGGDLSGYH